MNAQCYRVIFNKARGMLMVVSEAARSQGKTSNASEGGSDISQVAGSSQINGQTSGHIGYQGGQLDSLRSHVLLSLGLATIVATSVSLSAHADNTAIIADRNAAANQQAVILATSNGTTQVNIQSPSAAGVSRNVFSQFDVGQDGALLNNSRVNSQTQIAGWVEGNPYLARGEARVILNEVNSSDPSRLAGYTEIAGGRAELIIANPAGITCSGCSFINASRATLTTGQALMDQGLLTGFDIKGGNIRVDGDGLDTNTADYTQILAKTTEINAAIYAKNLDVINGTNTVSYEADAADTVITSKSSPSNQATGVALDVSALGAMYAGKIRLIGTEKGMGVTNAGSIIASNAGGLQLDNSGNLINTGSLVANKGKVDIDTRGNAVTNSGTIASSQSTATLTSSTLNNSGVINSYDTASLQQTGAITNSGEIAAGSFDVSASGLNNTGKLLQTGSGQLGITTKSLINSQGGIIGQDLYADASTPPVTAPTTIPPTTANNGSSVQENNTTTNPSEPAPVPLAPVTRNGTITVGTMTNTGGSLYSNDKINIATDKVTNEGKSSLAVSTLDIADKGSLSNIDSRLQLDEIDWTLASFDNSNSQLMATKTISITSADQINNTKGTLAAGGEITLTAKNQLKNTQGVIQSNAKITTVSSDFDNTQGVISSQDTLSIDANGNLTNDQGRLSSGADLSINSADLSNEAGTVNAKGKLNVTANRLNNSGQIYGQADSQITLTDALANSGLIASQADTTIKANTINQSGSGSLIAGMDADGKLSDSAANLTLNSAGNIQSQGQQVATGNASISGTSIELNKSTTQARNITVNASTGDISSQNAKITATGNLLLESQQGGLNNQGGEISAAAVDIGAKRLDNTEGSITQTGD